MAVNCGECLDPEARAARLRSTEALLRSSKAARLRDQAPRAAAFQRLTFTLGASLPAVFSAAGSDTGSISRSRLWPQAVNGSGQIPGMGARLSSRPSKSSGQDVGTTLCGRSPEAESDEQRPDGDGGKSPLQSLGYKGQPAKMNRAGVPAQRQKIAGQSGCS